jgi:hypothetical protein
MSYQKKLFPLDILQPAWYNTHMKNFTVIRYHSSPVTFSTLEAAQEFAWNCGDFKDLQIS